MTRVRFAPAPTGFLHIGGARTYIFNWFFAQKTQGQVVLRIDDTGVERSTEESLRSILEGLKWLELPWDEQHQQSERAGGADRAVGRPSAFAVFATLGRERVVERLRKA